jgi:hypothetical protein
MQQNCMSETEMVHNKHFAVRRDAVCKEYDGTTPSTKQCASPISAGNVAQVMTHESCGWLDDETLPNHHIVKQKKHTYTHQGWSDKSSCAALGRTFENSGANQVKCTTGITKAVAPAVTLNHMYGGNKACHSGHKLRVYEKCMFAFCSIAPHHQDAVIYDICQSSDPAKACQEEREKNPERLSLWQPPKYRSKQWQREKNGCDPGGIKAHCDQIKAAGTFLCVDPRKPWRCPVDDSGKFDCAATLRECEIKQGSARSISNVAQSQGCKGTTAPQVDFMCKPGRGISPADGKIPRQFEAIRDQLWFGSRLRGAGSTFLSDTQNLHTQSFYKEWEKKGIVQQESERWFIKFGHRTSAVKKVDDLCMMTGVLNKISHSKVLLVAPDWCRPTCCNIGMLPVRRASGVVPMVIRMCEDGELSKVGNPESDGELELAALQGFSYSRQAGEDMLKLGEGVENFGGVYQGAAVSMHHVSDGTATLCALRGFLKIKAPGWAAKQEIQIASIVSGPCTKMLNTTEYVVALATSDRDGANIEEFDWQTQNPARAKVTQEGVVQLQFTEEIKKDTMVYVSLSGVTSMASISKITKVMLRETGKSVSQCHFASRPHYNEQGPQHCDDTEMQDKTRHLNAFKQCASSLDQDTAELHVVGSSQKWPASLCALHGVAKFTEQKYDPELVAVLPLNQQDNCFPIRAVDMVAPEVDTGVLHFFVLEPQGVLRLKANGKTAVVLNLNNIYDPDVLTRELSHVDGRIAIYPEGAGSGATLPQRKGLTKDAIVYNGGGAKNTCACWMQKRLVCEKSWEGGSKCGQFKRLVRSIVMEADEGRAWHTSMMECGADDGEAFNFKCQTICTDRLLAL